MQSVTKRVTHHISHSYSISHYYNHQITHHSTTLLLLSYITHHASHHSSYITLAYNLTHHAFNHYKNHTTRGRCARRLVAACPSTCSTPRATAPRCLCPSEPSALVLPLSGTSAPVLSFSLSGFCISFGSFEPLDILALFERANPGRMPTATRQQADEEERAATAAALGKAQGQANE